MGTPAMTKLALAAVAVLLMTPALACDDDPAHERLLKRQTKALEDQARSARQLERIERDRTRMLERQLRNP